MERPLTILDTTKPKVQAIFLKAHLRLMKIGMKNSHLSQREMLNKATGVTGKKYPNSVAGIDAAIADLEEIK